jgi:arsenical pump membrane protein
MRGRSGCAPPACVALAPGVPPWAAAAPCAAAAVGVFAWRARGELGWGLLPWRLLVLTEGLFLVVTALAEHGLSALLAAVSGDSVLRTTAVAGVSSNLVNNLPAYLAVESAVPTGHTTQLLGALLGSNGGPLVLVWGSLATLLWGNAAPPGVCASAPGCSPPSVSGGVPIILVASWAALLLTS